MSDDLESFYHVLNWCTLKYLPYTLPGDFASLTTEGRARRFHELFDLRDTSDLNPKLLFVSAGHLLVGSLPGGDGNPLFVLLSQLAHLFMNHYKSDKVLALWRGTYESTATSERAREGPVVGPHKFGRMDTDDPLASDPESDDSESTVRVSQVQIERQAPPAAAGRVPGLEVFKPIENHRRMMSIFRPLLEAETSYWPPGACDKLPDQVPSAEDVSGAP